MHITRRDLFKLSGVAVAGVALGGNRLEAKEAQPKKIFTKQENTRVVVCGGGFGGLTVAKYLRQFNPQLEVIVIDKKDLFVSCPYSNVWLGGVQGVSFEDLCRSYVRPANKHGYSFLQGTITAIYRQKKSVVTDQGEIGYDYLVLAPGIEYDYSKITQDAQKQKALQQACPPALMPAGDHLALKKEIENFQGGNFIITVPSGKYRCPPAPYERACMVAYYFKKHKKDGKVVILDPREKPGAKPEGFLHSFKTLYPEIIEYVPNVSIKDVDLEKKEIITESFNKTTLAMEEQKFAYTFANIIPENRANSLIDLANIEQVRGGWAVLEEPSFRSVSDDTLYVVGDAINYPYPKSGQMANSCGYLAAKDLAYRAAGKVFDLLSETPANVCYSLVNADPKEGIVVHHSVDYSKEGTPKVSAKSTSKRDSVTGESVGEWYNGIIHDIFD